MGLFVKKDSVEYSTRLYTSSSSRSYLIVGLGNIGKEYAATRHNIGFMVVEYLAEQMGFDVWTRKKDLDCSLTSGTFNGARVILAKPTTLMNNSGQSVQKIMNFYKIADKDVLVVHDELDIDFGKIRTNTGGSAAGHNGIKSLIQHIGQDFGRLRIGIGPKIPSQIDSADFVLAEFSSKQQSDLPDIIAESVSIINDFVASGELYADTRTVIF